MIPWLAPLCAVLLLSASPVLGQDQVGHSGPVSAMAIGQDRLISGGFDGRAIQWDRDGATARRITRFHDGNVTAVAALNNGFVSAGQDGRLAIWRDGMDDPAHQTPAATSAVSALVANKTEVVAGFFDGSLLRLDRETSAITTLTAHVGRVSGLAFLPDGDVVSVGADRRFIRWGASGQLLLRTDLPELPNGMAAARDALAVVFADGTVQLLSWDGTLLSDSLLSDRPLVAVAASGDQVAAAAIDGTVWLLDLPDLEQSAQIAASDSPIWAVVMSDDALFSAGADGVIRQWSAGDGLPRGTAVAPQAKMDDDSSRGAQVYRACAVCHSLAPGDHGRAGPSLHGVFGKPIASAEGYAYSSALQGMDIIWTPETVSELFTLGPDAYTPGSRMPDQRVTDPADRKALVAYIARQSR